MIRNFAIIWRRKVYNSKVFKDLHFLENFMYLKNFIFLKIYIRKKLFLMKLIH